MTKLNPILTLLPVLASACGASRADAPEPSLFMDVHELGAGNVTAEAVAEAHEKDLAVQHKHDVRFIKYWVDEENGQVYCLAEAPSAEAMVEAHREAHGLLPETVGPVVEGA